MTALFKKPISLRLRLISGILLVSLVGFTMLIITATIYRNLAYQNQRSAITELIGLKVTNILEELSDISKNLGLDLQTDIKLRQAIKSADLKTIQSFLDMQFERYFVTSGMLKLQDIYIFDNNFAFVTNSSRGNSYTEYSKLPCSTMLSIAKKRVGAERLKPMSQLCSKQNEARFGVIVPVGSLNPFAYMLIVSDPAFSIIQLEQTLGDPIKITRYTGDIVYQSPVWPEEYQLEDFLIASHTLRDPNGSTILKTHAARDIEPYRQQLFNHALVIILVSTIIFTLVVAGLIYTLKASLRPLDELQTAAAQLSKGNYVKVSRTSIPEIDIVIQSFNKMAEEITDLIKKLQSEIFEHKKTEKNLKKHQHDLSLARDQAFAASRAKSVFLANMSHELRTPLNAIIGYSEMFFEDPSLNVNQQQLDDLTKIKSSGQHLLSIINDILDLSKIEAGKLELNLDHFDLETFINETVSTLQPSAAKNSNTLTVDHPPGIGTIYNDANKLRQCLLNVLDNACKFTNNGKINLYVEAQSRNEVEWIQFVVSDTGIGIGEDQTGNLFSEFTQADSSTTKSYESTGLGLALSQRFCELMGGYITFTSELGKGSEFSISIPKRAKRKNSVTYPKTPDNADDKFYKSA
jgi:signal transduction histidine kinase